MKIKSPAIAGLFDAGFMSLDGILTSNDLEAFEQSHDDAIWKN